MNTLKTHHIIFIGPPGSGKGTQASYLASCMHIPIISTGNILRQAVQEKTDLGIRVAQVMQEGGLVDDNTMIALLKQHLTANYILDGFPRTLRQAEMLDENNIAITHVCFFNIDDDIIVKRLSGRRIHKNSGRVYHIDSSPPRVEGIDNETGEALTIREDDHPHIIRDRLRHYHMHAQALHNFYHRKKDIQTIDINANQDIACIQARLKTFFK